MKKVSEGSAPKIRLTTPVQGQPAHHHTAMIVATLTTNLKSSDTETQLRGRRRHKTPNLFEVSVFSSFGRREILYSFKKFATQDAPFPGALNSKTSETSKRFSASALRCGGGHHPSADLGVQIPPEFKMDKGKVSGKDNVPSVRTCLIAQVDINILNI